MLRTITMTAAILLTATPAIAAGEIGLSRDGVSWSSTLPQPLFDPALRWVPGDIETSTFWVRNESEDGAVLDIAVLGSSIDALMETGDLTVTVVAAGGGGGSTTKTGRQELLSSWTVQPGDTERIDVTVALDPASTNQSQVKALDLGFEVRLTQASGGSHDSDGDSDDSDDSDDDGDSDDDRDRNGILPGAGGPAEWRLLAGLLGLGVGWLLIVASRRTRPSHE